MTSTLYPTNPLQNTLQNNIPSDSTTTKETNFSYTNKSFSGPTEKVSSKNIATENDNQESDDNVSFFGILSDREFPSDQIPSPPPKIATVSSDMPPGIASALAQYTVVTSQQGVMVLLGAVSAGIREFLGSCFPCHCSLRHRTDKRDRENQQGAWFDRGQVRLKPQYISINILLFYLYSVYHIKVSFIFHGSNT